jgi:DNA-binding transcriptional MocR family regulator
MLKALTPALVGGHLRVTRPGGGLYLWAQLRSGMSSRALLQDARATGVAFVAGEVFYPDRGGGGELRLCFSSLPPEQSSVGIGRLVECIEHLGAGQPSLGSVPIA